MDVNAAHALLGASSSARWLNCPPSAKMSEGIPDKPSKASLQGEALHELAAEALWNVLQGNDLEDSPPDNAVAMSYVRIAAAIMQRAKAEDEETLILLEQRVDYSRFVPGGFGRVDLAVISNGAAHVIDFKTGRGKVEADQNTQLMLYALGVLEMFPLRGDIDRIILDIIQPSICHRSTWEISRRDLMRWAKTRLRRTARAAFKGEGEIIPGDHCKFCPSKGVCPAHTTKEE